MPDYEKTSAKVDSLIERRARVAASPADPMPNARKFIGERYNHSARPLIVCQGGAFYGWDGTCWPEIEERQLRAELYAFFDGTLYEKTTSKGTELAPFQPNRHSVANLIDALRAVSHLPLTVTTPTWLGAGLDLQAEELVACRNGIVHVPTRTRYDATPSLYVRHAVPFDFDADAAAPTRWLDFLADLWPDDPESPALLQEVLGYLVSGDTTQQKMFLMVGPKRGGKGTIGRVLTALLGKHNVAGPTLASMGTNFGLSPVVGKPLAIISDARLSSSDSIVTERLLSISGEDMLTVDRKYREPWSGKLPTRILILTNELPRLVDSSGALASRFILLTLTRTFYGRENTALTEELMEELPGIFNWALDGLERLRERGRFVQSRASADSLRELEDLGSPVGAFLRDRCRVGPGCEVSVDDLWKVWKEWCEEQGRGRPGTRQVFGRDLRAAVPGLKVMQPRIGAGGSQVRVYCGIALGTSDHSAPSRVSSRVNDREHPLTRDDTRTNPLWIQSDEDLLAELPPDDREEAERDPAVRDAYLASRRRETL